MGRGGSSEGGGGGGGVGVAGGGVEVTSPAGPVVCDEFFLFLARAHFFFFNRPRLWDAFFLYNKQQHVGGDPSLTHTPPRGVGCVLLL